jgi:hypothetical protein
LITGGEVRFAWSGLAAGTDWPGPVVSARAGRPCSHPASCWCDDDHPKAVGAEVGGRDSVTAAKGPRPEHAPHHQTRFAPHLSAAQFPRRAWTFERTAPPTITSQDNLEQEDSKSNSSRTPGPFAGPKPESMMVPRGARRSDQQAHPSRLRWACRFLPSWS